jgi:PAS domain S-box-containing protein
MPSRPNTSIPTEFYRAAFEHAADAVVAIGEDRTILAANEAAAELFAVPLNELLGASSMSFYRAADEASERVWASLSRGLQVTAEVRIYGRTGLLRDVEVTTKGHVVPGVHVAILRDVTHRKLRDLSSRRYELLREHTEDVLLFISREGRILEANRAAETTYGYTRAELLSMSLRDLRHESSLAELPGRFAEALERGVRFETLHRRKDGTAVPVEVASRPAKVGGDEVLLSVIREVTERRELHAKLLEADRLWTFGMMAAGVAHEINNPLAYVLANTEVLARKLPSISRAAKAASRGEGGESAIERVSEDLARCEEMLAVVTEGLDRVRSIVRDLKTFSRNEPDEGTLVDVHQVLDAALNVAHSELRHRATLAKSYGEPPPVRGSTSRLGQVFLNLLVNAAQAIPTERRREGEVRVVTESTPTGWARIVIADDGVGIPKSAQGRLFHAFHTTKRGEGTGLGLYISRTIVDAHGGRIHVDSEEGVGTKVTVELPPYDSSLPHEAEPSARTVIPRRRVLVVDDEPAIGASMHALLEPFHDVEFETSVASATAKLERDATFDAILCDVMMPGSSGVDLLDWLDDKIPELLPHLVLMSGGILDESLRDRVARSGVPCLDKPLSSLDLMRIIEAAARRK